MEKIKVKINIAGSEFTVLSQDDEYYTNMIAEDVDKKINEIRGVNRQVSITAAAMLAALNFCDGLKKAEKETENLKEQIEKYLAEMSDNRDETDRLRKENQRLENDIQIYRKRLSEKSTVIDENHAPISTAVRAVKKSVSPSESEEAAEDDLKFFDITDIK